MIASELKRWYPHKLINARSEILCRWFYAGEKRFTEPFFDETIMKCLSHPFNSSRYRCVSGLDLLRQGAEGLPFVTPTAFIFHVSRCGSTLLSQLLSLSTSTIVLSEVPFLDEVLRLPYQNSNIETVDSDILFREALSFYGQKREGTECYLFVKTDSWHVLFYKRLRQLFPHIPFVLLYRKPDEVVYSHRKKRGLHAVPGLLEAAILGCTPAELEGLDLDKYLARVLEKYFAAFLDIIAQDDNTIVVNYSEGILQVLERIGNKTGMHFSAMEWEMVKERAGYDAKDPRQRFSESMVGQTPPDYLQRCFALYGKLEAYRFSNSDR
jgi:hypothetical protein